MLQAYRRRTFFTTSLSDASGEWQLLRVELLSDSGLPDLFSSVLGRSLDYLDVHCSANVFP